MLTCLKLTLLAAALSGFTSCATKPVTGPTPVGNPTGVANGFTGEVITDSASTTVTVVSVDPAKRLVVLKRPDGSTLERTVAPAAPLFGEIKPGDRIKLSMAEELAVFLGLDSLPPEAGPEVAPRLRARLPAGAQVIATEVATLNFSGQIAALNDWNDTVTIGFGGGLMKTIRVSEYVNLAEMNVGDRVSVRCVQAATLELDRP